MASRLHDATLHKPVQWPQRKRRGAHGSKRYLKGSCMNQHFETSACLPSTICCRKSWHNYIFRTWTHFNVWGPPFPSKDKVFSTNHVRKMCQGRNGHQQQGHQSDIYTGSTQSFHFWQESPAASSSATLRSSSSLAYRRSFVTNMRRPTSAIHVSNLFQQSHPKKGMREIGSHNCHFSWLTQIKQQQVACPSALLPGQDLHLAIEFQRPLPQPFSWLLLVLPALLIKQPTSTQVEINGFKITRCYST